MSKITRHWNNTDEEMFHTLQEHILKEKNRQASELLEEMSNRYLEKMDLQIEMSDYEEIKNKLSCAEDECERLENIIKQKEEALDLFSQEIDNLKKELHRLNKLKAQVKVLDLNNLHKLNEDLKNEERR